MAKPFRNRYFHEKLNEKHLEEIHQTPTKIIHQSFFTLGKLAGTKKTQTPLKKSNSFSFDICVVFPLEGN